MLAHKRNRTVHLGEHVTLLFEDELTIRYQIQEMLRIEKMFEESGIQQELDAYNPLVPDGSNLKATMLLEYEDADERRAMRSRSCGASRTPSGCASRGSAASRQSPTRTSTARTTTKTSAVHFVRFELTPAMIAAFKAGATVAMGVDHPNYQAEVGAISPVVQDTLASDFT